MFLRVGAIYDIILTKSIPINDATIPAVKHPKCILGKCKGQNIKKSKATFTKIAKRKFRKQLKNTHFYQDFVNKLPDLEGKKITLPYIY